MEFQEILKTLFTVYDSAEVPDNVYTQPNITSSI